ncbi:hydrolase or acyltransferase of alpha/beta superfamily protein [Halogeometricum borinquense DSM 11551]|uniref:Hydrolase or acyltransferase of alpha/beta superfamily protein n=1 Tax=Halogeometricum borinquense (strain ATCC 700274 / DSM 11551 / JCM 10706 / KCTC 4070 / PR3) TaxID=469382 RepID=E4NKY1_HALBP|nr:alpha/beta hydrolase [Halogeometricum borinquense]ADQ67133.1 predicted hydrolase or acyltransferase of alpha/beta superfamily [Halogeometricum borinquense DSM 11551]ELY29681.1 hydrolase or acyltransferase of alpha/beta superfamily protein [Halogeometricum borinquense DSM 11551]
MQIPHGATRRETALDGLRLSALVAGDPASPPVVLIHGGGLDSAELSWCELIPALTDDYRVYAIDLPGYGHSDEPERVPTTDYYVRVLERFLEAEEIDAPALVGVSLGGGVALGYALGHPEDVSAVVAINSYGLGDSVPGGPLGALFVRVPYLSELSWRAIARSRTVAYFAVRAIVAYGNVRPHVVDQVYEEAQRNDGSAWRTFQRAEIGFTGLRTNYVDDLPNLSMPTLFIHGEDDKLVPSSWSVRAESLVPNSEVRILPECGHWPPREQPQRVNSLVRLFLQSNIPVDM